MSGPRLNVSRTVRCPCRVEKVSGSPAELVKRARGILVCRGCGRRFVERAVSWRGEARFAFVWEACACTDETRCDAAGCCVACGKPAELPGAGGDQPPGDRAARDR